MDIERLSQEWIKANDAHNVSVDENHWSVEYIFDLEMNKNFDELWEFIKVTYKQNLSDKVLASLAAGPMEELLAKAGEYYIDEIEQLARKDPQFNNLLGGVWQNTTPIVIWERIQKIRNKIW